MQATIKPIENGILIFSPYNADFVSALKDEIDRSEREWRGAQKAWWVNDAAADRALEVVRRFYEILDSRMMSNAAIEEKKLDAEIEKIKAHQQFILEREDWIKNRIDDLSGSISRYSMRSVSSVKHGKAVDRALLQHALDNARMPVEQMTELQVRGLAAAARYVEEA